MLCHPSVETRVSKASEWGSCDWLLPITVQTDKSIFLCLVVSVFLIDWFNYYAFVWRMDGVYCGTCRKRYEWDWMFPRVSIIIFIRNVKHFFFFFTKKYSFSSIFLPNFVIYCIFIFVLSFEQIWFMNASFQIMSVSWYQPPCRRYLEILQSCTSATFISL